MRCSALGLLYIWGFGESIHPREMSNIVDTPRLVRMKEKVKRVAIGQSHVLILTGAPRFAIAHLAHGGSADVGDVFVFGNGHMGQLGHGSTSNVRYPRLVLKGKEIMEIAAGRYHSMAVTAYGVLYSWGCGESGQLAHNSLESGTQAGGRTGHRVTSRVRSAHNARTVRTELFPTIVDAMLPNVVGQIACGEHHSFCMSCETRRAPSPPF